MRYGYVAPFTAWGRSPIGRGRALKPPPVRVRVPPPLRGELRVQFFSSVARVANSTSGKWVSRVGASGGGKAYKKARPGNYYGVLAVIVVLGLFAAVYSRYEYQHPSKGAAGVPPTVGTTWYASLAIENCGVQLPALTPDPSYKGGFTVQAPNVIKVSPVTAADSGVHATLSQFAAEFPGLIVSSTELAVPNSTGTANQTTTFKNGQVCGTSTKYAGQAGHVSVAYWTSFAQKKPIVTTDPTKIKFAQYLRVTMAFDPTGVTPAPPSQLTVNAMVKAGSAPATTTTLTPVTLPITSTSITVNTVPTPTTAPATTPTTAPITTTTAAKG